jgi:hypothetical protein
MAASAATYPATMTFDPPANMPRWRALFSVFAAIPHLVVLSFLGSVAQALGIIAWIMAVFTGKVPKGIADVQSMYLRYSMRATLYALAMSPEYPPFTFDMTAADPGDVVGLRVDITPQLEDRNRVTAFFRILLAIPHFIALLFVGIAAAVAIWIGLVAVLFTGRWPEGLRTFALNMTRWSLRVQAYTMLLTDEYPPFELG